MIKVYATALAVGVLGLIVVVVGGALAESTGRDDRDPAHRIGHRGRLALGATLGFGMGGMASEFSPLGPSWPVSLLIAVVAATISIIWVRYTSSPTGPE